MADGPELRVSKVAPVIEANVGELAAIVKQLGRSRSNVTESQASRMVTYLGNLDEMRSQVVVMIQRYEDDMTVLTRLLALMDRIDDVKSAVDANNRGFENDSNQSSPAFPRPSSSSLSSSSAAAASSSSSSRNGGRAINNVSSGDGGDEEGHHHTHFTADPEFENLQNLYHNASLTVSGFADLGVSGTWIKQLYGEDALDVNERDVGGGGDSGSEADDEWDVPLTEDEIAALAGHTEDAVGDINLSASTIIDRGEPDHQNQNRRHTAGWMRSQPGALSSASSSSARKKCTWEQAYDEALEEQSNPTPLIPCLICGEDYKKRDIVELTQCEGLFHTYCRTCYKMYLEVIINDGAVLGITCPDPTCESEVPPSVIMLLCSAESFVKYEKFTLLAALRADPDVRWCPFPDCGEAVKCDPKIDWVACKVCTFQFCTKCGEERHDGASCGREAFEMLQARRLDRDKVTSEFNSYMTSNETRFKPCPGCRAYIEKNMGCNHMTCKNVGCRAQFCWLCNQPYESSHYNNRELFPDCYNKQYWEPPVVVDPEMAARYPIYFPPNYQYAGIDGGPLPAARPKNYKKVAKKVGVYIGVGVAVVTLGVPAAVIGGPIFGAFKLHERLKAKKAAVREARARREAMDRYRNGNEEDAERIRNMRRMEREAGFMVMAD